MKTKINLLIFLMFVMLFILGSNASEAMKTSINGGGKISGNIRSVIPDSPLQCVSVTLFSVTDSSVVVGTISDNYGNFYISMLDQGDYFLEISEHGYETQQISDLSINPGGTSICLNEIMLKPVTPFKGKNKRLFKISL